jgi:hypothetical protein
VFIHCTLKRSPELSHTQGLIDLSAEIIARQGVSLEQIRAVDHDLALADQTSRRSLGGDREAVTVLQNLNSDCRPQVRSRSLRW